MTLTFPKSERLRLQALVDPLFREGKSLFEYPMRLVYRPLSAEELERSFRICVPDGIAPLQVMFTVPKNPRQRSTEC